MQQRLTRSRSERVIWGVCGGLGVYFGVDPVIVRLIFIVLALTTGIGFLAYPLLALAMPLEPVSGQSMAQGYHAAGASSAGTPNTSQTISLRVDEAATPQYAPPQAAPRQPRERWRTLGFLLLGLGVFFLADQLGFEANLIWPVIIIGFGAWLLRRRP